ncbi:MAG: hypothetical protein C0614_08540 [Desulfuromonas sp.]|nr:MAG: hypothetical protein C0614_08540 [Desulfuromonas sp.]
MSANEQEPRFFLIDSVLRDIGDNDHQWVKMEAPAPDEPTRQKGRRYHRRPVMLYNTFTDCQAYSSITTCSKFHRSRNVIFCQL